MNLLILLLIILGIGCTAALVAYFTRKHSDPSPVQVVPVITPNLPEDEGYIDDGFADNLFNTTFPNMPSNLFLNPKGDPTKTAILFGINECSPMVYQGDSLRLRGCVNDSLHVRSFLCNYGSYGKIWLFRDKEATIGNFLDVWRRTVADLKDGDTLLLQMSRHGMSLGKGVLDNDAETSKVVSDGVFSGDQAAVMHDGIIVDDCFWRLFLELPRVKLIYLNDSCHSATQYKLADLQLFKEAQHKYRARRAVSNTYLPAKNKVLDLAQLDKLFPSSKKEPLFTLVSIAGCQDWEFAADAFINRKYQGAFTFALLNALNKKKDSTPRELIESVPKILKSRGFTQNPQINIEGDQSYWDKPLV